MNGATPSGPSLEALLEPGALAGSINDEARIQLSVAISLRRIADSLDGLKTGEGMDGLHGAITNIAWEAARSFAAG